MSFPNYTPLSDNGWAKLVETIPNDLSVGNWPIVLLIVAVLLGFASLYFTMFPRKKKRQ